MPTLSASGRYSALQSLRDPYLRRARDCAKLTIPALLPEEGANGSTSFATPYQSIGARGVNNLASKLLLTLIPASSSFFRFQIDDFALEDLTKQEGLRAAVEEGLGRYERAVMSDIESTPLRTVGFEAFKQLVNSGNVLLHLPRNGEPRMFRLDKYVVKRSPSGKPLEIVVREEVSPSALEPDILALLPDDVRKQVAEGVSDVKSVPLFTVVRLLQKNYRVYQEINGKIIEGTEGTFPADQLEWLPLRFIRVDGEDYGRSYVEEYLGDLKSLEGLEKSIIFGSAAAAKVLFLVNPNGTTKMKDISDAPSGAVRQGTATDVTVMQLQKYGDFRVALEKSANLERRLSFAFLLNTSIQRDGERVTAEEVRFMAQELEDALGGIYSIMSQEFQRPLVNLTMAKLRAARKLPQLPKGAVKPVIVTGVEALGRGQDLRRLDDFINGIPAPLQQAALQYLNIEDYLKRRAVALGVDQKGLVKTGAQVQQENQQAQQQAMIGSLVDKGTGPAIQAMSKGAEAPAA